MCLSWLWRLLSLLNVLLLFSTVNAYAGSDLLIYPQAANDWFAPAAKKIQLRAESEGQRGIAKAKNIILFVGDGMGVSTVTAARIFAGQQKGLAGEEFELSFDKFPYSGLARTYNTNAQTPDSAGTMTALVTGVKTKAGVLSINDNVIRGDCASQKGNELLSAIELAEFAGMSTGIVSTARITHATPAATYASAADRGWESDKDMDSEAKAAGCEDIASQLVYFPERMRESLIAQSFASKIDKKRLARIDGLDVILGGGLRAFLPEGEHSLGAWKTNGRRLDQQNLLETWVHRNKDGLAVHSSVELKRALAKHPDKILGLFSESHMAYEAERKSASTESLQSSEPSLAEMTAAAIGTLSKNKKGYFLMVEAGRIDHAHHINNAFNALSDTLAFSEAVALAVEKTNKRDTLIIVTADHSHVFTMAGYPQRGNPILGKVIGPHPGGKKNTEFTLDAQGKPYTTLGYMNGRGQAFLEDNTDPDQRYQQAINAGRQSLKNIDTENSGYHQESLVALESETHGGEDVAIYARGPGAYLISGSHEQNVIFHAMNYAANLLGRAEANLFK
ncbi:alkaline phosphatase [Alteromonadaceae bacterium Bs31]|nr:alkaline phosphatase [Alteromonadaceae bacterium Bs31]